MSVVVRRQGLNKAFQGEGGIQPGSECCYLSYGCGPLPGKALSLSSKALS